MYHNIILIDHFTTAYASALNILNQNDKSIDPESYKDYTIFKFCLKSAVNLLKRCELIRLIQFSCSCSIAIIQENFYTLSQDRYHRSTFYKLTRYLLLVIHVLQGSNHGFLFKV